MKKNTNRQPLKRKWIFSFDKGGKIHSAYKWFNICKVKIKFHSVSAYEEVSRQLITFAKANSLGQDQARHNDMGLIWIQAFGKLIVFIRYINKIVLKKKQRTTEIKQNCQAFKELSKVGLVLIICVTILKNENKKCSP